MSTVVHSDPVVGRALAEAWDREPHLRSMLEHTSLRAEVRDGVVTVHGYSWTRKQADLLERVARSVEGVREVRTDILVDEDLTNRVAQALARDKRTHDLRLSVATFLGNVRISGVVPDDDARVAAALVAASIPRVKSVVNTTLIGGRDPIPNDPEHGVTPGQPVTFEDPPLTPGRNVEPLIGQRVLTHDGEFGKVARVVLDPQTLLLAGIVVDGVLPMPDEAAEAVRSDDVEGTYRRLYVPATWIEVVANEVLLRLRLSQAAALPEFRPSEFREVSHDWLPPFPYQRDDVLFTR